VKRFGALVVAALLIVAAVYVRGRLDDDSAGSDQNDSASTVSTLVCVTELDAVCRELDRSRDDLTVRIEDAAATESTLVSPTFDVNDPPFDAWLTLAPFPDMVSEQRSRALLPQALDDTTDTLGRSPVVVAVWNDRRDVLASTCAGGITWRCIGDNGGRAWPDLGGSAAWGGVKPSHSLPDATASGLFALSQATASYFGRTDFARNDFAGDPAFRRWFEQLERSIPSFPAPPRTPLDEMLSKGPAVFDLAGSLEAAAGPAIARSRDKDRLSILYPSPATVADVVVAPVANTSRGDRVTKLLQSNEVAALLAQAGWRVDGQPLADGVDPAYTLPSESGLPRPGVLEALRALWIETIR
jgi:hypothetical protein